MLTLVHPREREIKRPGRALSDDIHQSIPPGSPAVLSAECPERRRHSQRESFVPSRRSAPEASMGIEAPHCSLNMLPGVIDVWAQAEASCRRPGNTEIVVHGVE